MAGGRLLLDHATNRPSERWGVGERRPSATKNSHVYIKSLRVGAWCLGPFFVLHLLTRQSPIPSSISLVARQLRATRARHGRKAAQFLNHNTEDIIDRRLNLVAGDQMSPLGLAKGRPLSLRIAAGRPQSRSRRRKASMGLRKATIIASVVMARP